MDDTAPLATAQPAGAVGGRAPAPKLPDQSAAPDSASTTRVDRAFRAIRWIISLTLVQQSGRIFTECFLAAFEIAVWVRQFCVVIPQISSSSTPSLDSAR